MPLYRLTEEQHKSLLNIIANVQIRGQEAPAVVQLFQALNKTVPEPEEKKKDE